MDFLRNYFIVLLILFVSVFHIKFTLGVADSSKLDANYDFGHYKVLDLTQQFHMSCNITDSSLAASNAQIRWYKDNELLKTTSQDGRPYLDVSGKNLKILKPSLKDVGMYYCQLYGNGTELAKIMIDVVVKPYVKLTSQLTFIEGEELKIECNVMSQPVPVIMWKFEDTEYRESGGRVELKPSSSGVPNAIFVIKNTEKSDRGNYTCSAINTYPQGTYEQVTGSSASYVRIKDKFAALWPFLGICVEVVVLCAIIFVYEKKRNKAELEESDTDQSPEQHAFDIAEEFSRGFLIIPLRESTEDLTRVLMFYPDLEKSRENSLEDSAKHSRRPSIVFHDNNHEKSSTKLRTLVERDSDLEIRDETEAEHIMDIVNRKKKKLSKRRSAQRQDQGTDGSSAMSLKSDDLLSVSDDDSENDQRE